MALKGLPMNLGTKAPQQDKPRDKKKKFAKAKNLA